MAVRRGRDRRKPDYGLPAPSLEARLPLEDFDLRCVCSGDVGLNLVSQNLRRSLRLEFKIRKGRSAFPAGLQMLRR